MWADGGKDEVGSKDGRCACFFSSVFVVVAVMALAVKRSVDVAVIVGVEEVNEEVAFAIAEVLGLLMRCADVVVATIFDERGDVGVVIATLVEFVDGFEVMLVEWCHFLLVFLDILFLLLVAVYHKPLQRV